MVVQITIEDTRGLNKLIAAMLAMNEKNWPVGSENGTAAYEKIWEEIKCL